MNLSRCEKDAVLAVLFALGAAACKIAEMPVTSTALLVLFWIAVLCVFFSERE